MPMKDQELQTPNKSKLYRIIDPVVFLICLLHFALWVNRILYVRNDNVYPIFRFLAVDCLPTLRVLLYVIPMMVLMTLPNRKFVLNSFAGLSVKCTLITLFMIYVLR